MESLIPRLILHQEAAWFLCRERSGSEDEAESLTSRNYIDMGFDDSSCSSSDSDSDDSSVSSSDSSESSLDDDVEAQHDIAPQISPLGVATRSNESLFYKNDEVHAFGKTKNVVESTVAGAHTVAKKTIQGAEKVARNTVKTTGKVAKQTGKTTRKVAKKTGKVAKKTAKETEKAVKKTANAAVGLPHELSKDWWNIALLVVAQILGPVFVSMFSVLTIHHSVDEGLSHNRAFVYGTHTLMDLFTIAPFILTCAYAIPDAKIPVGARIKAVLIGLVFAKLVLAIVSEAWWSPDTIFPVPFSFIVTMFVSLPSSLISLWAMSPMRNDPVIGDKIRTKFKLCFGLLASFVLSLVVACLWAVMFRRLSDRPSIQFIWNIFYQVLEFLLKIAVAANVTTRLNPQRWLQLNTVVDLMFASVQIANLPFFANWQTVFFSVLTMMLTTAWRAYAGVDRLMKFFAKSLEVVKSSDGAAAALKGIGGLAAQVTTSPVKDINLSARLKGHNAQGDVPEFDLEGEEDDIEMQSIERSETEETASTSEESQSTNDEGAVPTNGKETEPKIDRRAQFRNQKSRSDRNSVLKEVIAEQRHLYHVVDSVSSAVLVTDVRLAFIITTAVLRAFVSDHINASFQIPEEQWIPIIGYAIVFIVGIVAVIGGVGVYIRYAAKLGGLNLNRIISFMFQDSFWFFLSWFMLIQHINIALQLNHYGADFSLKFEWLSCREEGEMDWPRCAGEL